MPARKDKQNKKKRPSKKTTIDFMNGVRRSVATKFNIGSETDGKGRKKRKKNKAKTPRYRLKTTKEPKKRAKKSRPSLLKGKK